MTKLAKMVKHWNSWDCAQSTICLLFSWSLSVVCHHDIFSYSSIKSSYFPILFCTLLNVTCHMTAVFKDPPHGQERPLQPILTSFTSNTVEGSVSTDNRQHFRLWRLIPNLQNPPWRLPPIKINRVKKNCVAKHNGYWFQSERLQWALASAKEHCFSGRPSDAFFPTNQLEIKACGEQASYTWCTFHSWWDGNVFAATTTDIEIIKKHY